MRTANLTDLVLGPAAEKADCTISSTDERLVWLARQNDQGTNKLSDVPVAISYKHCWWHVEGRLVEVEEGVEDADALTWALIDAFRAKRVAMAAALLGCTAQTTLSTDAYRVFSAGNKEVSVEIRFYGSSYCYMGDSNAPIRNVAVKNLAAHLAAHLKRRIAGARRSAKRSAKRVQGRRERVSQAVQAAEEFRDELHRAGIASTKAYDLTLVSCGRKDEGSPWAYVMSYERADRLLSATFAVSQAEEVKKVVESLEAVPPLNACEGIPRPVSLPV